jgi:hypothetical protein
MSNCSSASGAGVCAGAAMVMQAVESESETLILYYSDLRGQWSEARAQALAAALPYAKRLEVASRGAAARATLAGIALALRTLAQLRGRRFGAAELRFPQHGKPHLAAGSGGADFSISHSGPWVGCAVVSGGLVGFDVETDAGPGRPEWAAREAALKACGLGAAAAREVELGEGGAVCRGVRLHGRPLALFPGATACVMTSLAVSALEARALELGELFAS